MIAVAIIIKTKKYKISKKIIAGYIIGTVSIATSLFIMFIPVSHGWDGTYSMADEIISEIEIIARPVIRTVTLGGAKISIYSFDDKYTMPSEYGYELESGKKAINFEFHAESSTGENINKGCYFDIVDKIDSAEDEKYNHPDKKYNNSSSVVNYSYDRNMSCPTDQPNDYIVRTVYIVNSKATKLKLRYKGDKIYYLDLN